MSTSRDSRIGWPLSSDSRTANSRARSCSRRAIRNRYLPRSAGRIGPQVRVNARRAARTARSTSSAVPAATSERTSSVAGLTVLNESPLPSTNSPSTNRPWDGATSTIDRDSGAGAYWKGFSVIASVDRHVVGAGVVAGAQLLPLQEQVVEQAGGAEAEPVGGEPVGPGDLVDEDQVLDRVLRRPDAAGGLDPDLAAGGGAEVADRLQHDQADRQGGGGGHLAGGGLDEVAAGEHRQPGGAADVVQGHQLAGLEDDLEVRVPARLLHRDDLVEHVEVAPGQEGAAVDDHVDLVGAVGHGVPHVGELDRAAGPAAGEGGGDGGDVDVRARQGLPGDPGQVAVDADRGDLRCPRVGGVGTAGLGRQAAHLPRGVGALEGREV